MEFNQRKRQLTPSSLDEPKAKHSAVVQPLKLVDLHDDILEKIFSYLDVQDLISVVNSDKVYLNSSRRAFKRTYDGIYVPFFDEYHPTRQCFLQNAELVRYFGESCSGLGLKFNDHPIDQRIFHLIVTCCRETLTELEIFHPTAKLKFNKSFPKVQKLILSNGHLNLSTSQLVKLFPSLEDLELDCIEDVGWLLNSGQRIASLKFLSLDMSDESFTDHFYRIQDLNSFIAVNPQLNDLTLSLTDYNIDTFEGEPQPNLQDEIVPDELMSVTLYIPFDENNSGHLNSLAHLKIPNDRIEHLEFHLDELTDQICDYIAKCVHIKTLKVVTNMYHDPWNNFTESSWMNLKFDFLSQLEISMAELEDYYIDTTFFCKFALEAIGPFLKQVKSLTTSAFRVQIYHQRTTPLDLVFDPIRSSIDFKMWSFAQTILKNEISFTLSKIKA